jgi:hypothetical protein
MKSFLIGIIFIIAFVFVLPAAAQDPDTKNQIGGGVVVVREDATFQSVKPPNLKFNRATDIYGGILHGTDFLGKNGGGPIGFTVECLVTGGNGRRLNYCGFGAAVEYRKGRFNPGVKATFGGSSQNDFQRLPDALPIDQRGVGFGAKVSAYADVKISKHFSWRLAEVGVLWSDIGKGGADATRRNLLVTTGPVITWGR